MFISEYESLFIACIFVIMIIIIIIIILTLRVKVKKSPMFFLCKAHIILWIKAVKCIDDV